MSIQVKVKYDDAVSEELKKGSEGASGYDIRACLPIVGAVVIHPNSRINIKTGVYMEIPLGYEVQVRPRSGLASKHGITVLNTPGTIDSDYRGEIQVILYNSSDKAFVVNHGDRIAQLVVQELPVVELVKVNGFETQTERGEAGFGSTGVK